MKSAQTTINDLILKRFALLLANNRLAHAYLFMGPHGIGKSEAALNVARLITCENNPDGRQSSFCGTCASCRRIDSGNHPDVMFIDKGEEQSIRIARVRELIARIQLKPYEARLKIFIIKNIEDLTLEGSNALLKTLEEPSKDSLLILTTAVPERNLDTVRSRCHGVHFFALSGEQLAAQLKQEFSLEEKESHFLAYFSEGCLGRARELTGQGFFDKKNDIIDNIVFRGVQDSYLKAISGDKEEARVVLNVLLAWFRDLILLKVGAHEDRLVNTDRVTDLARLAKYYNFEQLTDIVNEIVNTLKLLEDNLNVKIPMALLKEEIWVK